jgi:DNA topoisomerase-2
VQGTLALNPGKAQGMTLNTGKAQGMTLTTGQAQGMTLTTGQAQGMTLTTGQAQGMTLNTGQAQGVTLNTQQTAKPRQQTFPTANDYKQYDHRTHVYMKSDTYIGSDKAMQRGEWLLDLQNMRMVNTTIDFVPGCERLYLEVLTNASDNVGRSRRAGVDPGCIEILMDNSSISITNYGLPIPIEMHPVEKVYVPQMIFGSLLTSSNYEVERHEAGTNGIGAKAANIFSKEFMLIVHDHIRQLKYTQVWNNNMIDRGEPIIEQYEGKLSSVQVVYKMDFARFGYPVPNGVTGGYTAEAFSLFARHALDISFTAKTTVTFNGHEFKYSNIRDYARLYFGDIVDTAIVHYQWPAGTDVVHKKKGYQVARNSSITPIIELIAIDTPDEGHHVSFVNCMMTRDGGVHTNAAVKAVGDSAVKMINESVIKRLTKQNKGKELDAKEKRSHTINIADVRPHISVLLSAKLVDPVFTSQSKTMLSSPTPKIDVPEEELRAMNRWQLIDRLYAAIEAKQFASMAKTDGKTKRHVRLQKGVDANNAGKALRRQCVLYVTEGNSGAGYANKLVGLVQNGRDNIGVLPMRGKLFNVMGKTLFQIEKNNEIEELKKMLGLREGADYSLEENYSKLRYGALMIMADSDVDGKHIVGLILNFFHCRFPSLLARGFVMYYRTPTLRVTFNRTTLKFYTQSEYEEWRIATPNFKSWTHKYYKGLGTSKDSEIKDDFRTPRVVTCFYDADAPEAMRLAFDKKLTDQRKDWIGRWRPVLGADDVQMQPISWFINHELILFSIADVERSIPKLTDGFKESHRKIVHGAHRRWKVGSKKELPEAKTAQFGAFVADKSAYQHGEQILNKVIIGMAQDFIGANNITLFTRDGQFGTRYNGGEDAADPRYSYTRPERIMSYILRKEDRPILKHLNDDGEDIEPETYYPIIPMVLINGTQGIGTGHSTTIPSHNPLDVIKWLRLKLQGTPDEDLPAVLPWYRNFQGVIKVIDRRRRKRRGKVDVTIINNTQTPNGDIVPQVHNMEAEDEPANVDEDLTLKNETIGEDNDDDEYVENRRDDGTRPLLSMVTLGKFHIDLNGVIVVTELPIGRFGYKYRKWLEGLVDEKKITDYRDLSVNDTIYFEIHGFSDTPNHRTLKLQRTIGMSNMVLLDDNNRPVRYDTAFDILEAFYAHRLPAYQRRKDYMLGHLAQEISTMTHKIRFIQAVINKEIRIINRKKATIYEALDAIGIPHEIYDKSMNHHLSEDDITRLNELIAVKRQELEMINNTSPEQMWIRDLDELEPAYRSIYGIKRETITLSLGQPANESAPIAPEYRLLPGGLRPVAPGQRQQAHAIVQVPYVNTTQLTVSPNPHFLNLTISPLGQ